MGQPAPPHRAANLTVAARVLRHVVRGQLHLKAKLERDNISIQFQHLKARQAQRGFNTYVQLVPPLTTTNTLRCGCAKDCTS